MVGSVEHPKSRGGGKHGTGLRHVRKWGRDAEAEERMYGDRQREVCVV